ncbi:helix-turn-helix transcriptional regulator [Enterococcus sp. PF-2]|uniref:helix-turn-helix domain-containing protein n=1 Tax=unclassified Enterococcus TaxID=2608891 RepID=UPI00111F5B39|nr:MULTISPECIES: helix-turn-helix transcriptional regulator [unclassified Enterococcus]TPE08290.1 helix-turn-helix transcriptional regulator [Enterococcus sp. PF-3]TPE29381.1 helix-turn-helix transcriptional regulator [Enterococcus sp. PF-2]
MSEFNMRKIGQQIATKRKEKNLTQSNLADQLLVSYQAVSNWERGNSLPDIEKLPQLAAILGLSIDELLGKPAAAVQHYQAGTAQPKEIAELAPLIKPQELSALIQEEPFQESSLDLDLLPRLAPHLNSADLQHLLNGAENIPEDVMEELLPFLKKPQIEEILKGNHYSMAFWEEAAPFLTPNFLAGEIKGWLETPDFRFSEIEELLPFLPTPYLDELLLTALEQPNVTASERLSYDEIEELLPFLTEATICRLVQALPFSTDELEEIAPFLSSKNLLVLLKKGH